MDLRHLRYFQAVAEELSYARAARRLRVAQPALSRAVKELEEDLGVEVLERSRHFVRVTPAGAVLLQEAGLLLDGWEEALRRVRRTAAGEEGELRLGYIGPPTQPFLGRLLHEYRALYPLVSLRLEERTPERVWEMVAQGRVAVGLTRPVPSHTALGLRTALLREERLGVALRADHPLAGRDGLGWHELAGEPLVVLARREGASLHDAILAACRSAGFMPRLAHTPSLIGTVLSYAEGGAGLGIVTDSVVPPGSGLRFVALSPAQTVPLVMVWQEDRDGPAVQRFRELVLAWQAGGLLWGAREGEVGGKA